MNDKKRESVKEAVSKIKSAEDILENVLEEEQDSYDNIPENLQDSEKAEKMSVSIDSLESALGDIEAALEELHDVVQ